MQDPTTRAKSPFHLMIKPAGAACNLACAYCYYLEKARLYPDSRCMDDATLERVTAAYLAANPAREVVFGWQGGEPLLMGLDFYRRALELQARHARPGQRVQNVLQTNATLLTDAWAFFFAENGFLVGVSLDGPPEMHDRYRRSRDGAGSHADAVAGLETLQSHGVDVNALVTVNRENMAHPIEVYRHLTGLGVEHVQFIPIVEWEDQARGKLKPWSVHPELFGPFLCTVFDEWARTDVGRVFVQIFESALSVWLGGPPSLCVFDRTCGRGLVAEHTGDLYACDHFVTRRHCRGSITPDTLAGLVDGREQEAFGRAKADLPRECGGCKVLRFCGGDCPRHRTPAGKRGKPISVLCPAYRQFFSHSGTVLQAMAMEVRAGRPAAGIMDLLQTLRS